MNAILIINPEDFDLYFNDIHINFKQEELKYLKIKNVNFNKIIILFILCCFFSIWFLCFQNQTLFLLILLTLIFYKFFCKPIYSVNIVIGNESFNFQVDFYYIKEFLLLEKIYQKRILKMS